jgi:hypothetical protein
LAHDPRRHLTYLRQALESDKRPLALFLGAGCPLAIRVVSGATTSPLIPDISGLLSITDGAAAASEDRKAYETLKAHFREDHLGTPNIETLLSHIRALRIVAGAGTVRGVTAEQLDRVEALITKSIVGAVNKSLPSSDSPYHRMAAWIAGLPRHDPIEVFTTNYDLLVEQALEETRTPFFDGFVGAREPFFDVAAIEDDVLPARWARLWKIHGSINWSIASNGQAIRVSGSGQGNLIYPSHLKYEQSRRMPYLAMLDRLKTFLRHNSAFLVTVGYSFRDDHINEAIVQGLQGNSSSMAFGLMHGNLTTYPTGTQLARRRVNLTLLGRDAGIVATRSDGYSGFDGPPATGIEATPATDTEASITRVVLGDFAVFSEFLREMVGGRSMPLSDG